MTKCNKVAVWIVGCVADGFSKYACMRGRAPRGEYWGFIGLNVLLSLILFISGIVTMMMRQGDPIFLWILGAIYTLAALLPSLAATVRRLHDTGRGAMNLLWLLLPAAGWAVFLVLMLKEGSRGPNRYGPEP